MSDMHTLTLPAPLFIRAWEVVETHARHGVEAGALTEDEADAMLQAMEYRREDGSGRVLVRFTAAERDTYIAAFTVGAEADDEWTDADFNAAMAV
jgi:hypothetical protein